MTIQRQFSLPNCKLVLEGLVDESAANGAPNGVSGRPLLSILVNAECHFVGYEKPLTGGRDFLDSLVTAVSDYAQEYLSGVPHPNAHNGGRSSPNLVALERLDSNLHRLTVYPPNLNGGQPNSHSQSPLQIDLRTVQLFDLVEAIDQLFADTQTLPDLKRDLAPIPKRYAVAQEPVTKRVIPAALGISGLAVAAIALFFVPIPERRPEPASGESSTEQTTDVSPIPAGDPPAASGTPDAAVESESLVSPNESLADEPSPTDASSDSVASDVPSPITNPDASDDTVSAAPSSEEISEILSATPEITDIEQIEQLTRQLRDQLDASWQERPNFDEDLIYRVSVGENGDILGFRYVNDAAVAGVDQTPLLDLRYNPIDPTAPIPESLAQFRVVFTPGGVVEVSPWHGRPPEPDAEPTP